MPLTSLLQKTFPFLFSLCMDPVSKTNKGSMGVSDRSIRRWVGNGIQIVSKLKCSLHLALFVVRIFTRMVLKLEILKFWKQIYLVYPKCTWSCPLHASVACTVRPNPSRKVLVCVSVRRFRICQWQSTELSLFVRVVCERSSLETRDEF